MFSRFRFLFCCFELRKSSSDEARAEDPEEPLSRPLGSMCQGKGRAVSTAGPRAPPCSVARCSRTRKETHTGASWSLLAAGAAAHSALAIVLDPKVCTESSDPNCWCCWEWWGH